MRVSREVTFATSRSGDRGLTLGVDAFNLLNRVNDASFVGTIGSPLFRRPITARAPRQLQFSARVRF